MIMNKQTILYALGLGLFLIGMKVMCMDRQNTIYFPKPSGPYVVGTTSYHLIDTLRKNEFVDDPLHPHRELMVQVWYPAQGNAIDVAPISYSPDAIGYWKTKINAAGKVNKEQLESLDKIAVYEKKDARLMQHAPFPLLIFSPGFAQMRTANTALCEQVASYGYMVVSIDYTYFAEQVTFPDGTVISGIMVPVDTIEKEQHLEDIFVRDVAFVIQELTTLNNNVNSLVYKGIDIGNVGIFGHSVGGSTALFATNRLNEIKAGLNLDGGIFGNKNLLTSFNKPFMHINAQESVEWASMLKTLADDQLINYGFQSRGDRDKILEKTKFMMTELHADQTTDVYRIVINGTGHMSFCDAIFLKDNSLLEPLLHLRFGIGSLSGQKVTELTTVCIVTFFDTYLKNKSYDIKKMLTVYPEIEVQ